MARALVSVHVVDIARGVPASGLLIELIRRTSSSQELLARQVVDGSGKAVFGPDVVSERVLPCRLTLNLHIGDYYRNPSSAPFVVVAPFHFVLADASYHHHLPAKITPFGLSLFVTRSSGPTAENHHEDPG